MLEMMTSILAGNTLGTSYILFYLLFLLSILVPNIYIRLYDKYGYADKMICGINVDNTCIYVCMYEYS